MPQLLKNDTIRLLESSIENLNLCIEIIQRPQRIPLHDNSSYLSIPTGLLGISFELLCSALIVQIYSEKKLFIKENGYYKTSSQILGDLKKILKNPTPSLDFLSKGISNKNSFYKEILSKLQEFTLLSKLRASSVHCAKSPSKEVTIVYINKLLDLFKTIKRSDRICSYLSYLPELNISVVENNILIEELINKMSHSQNLNDSSELLISLFLVLPDIPMSEPEWLDKLERVQIAPKSDDINFLLKVLDDCESVSFLKSKGSGNNLAVSIQQGNPLAIPIDPHYIRKEFTKFKDQFYADIATANGRLSQNQLDIPSIDSVYYIISNKIEFIDSKFIDIKLVHQDSWSFIIRSLSQQGTIGPYWYFIRSTENLNQLKFILKKSIGLGSGYLKRKDRSIEIFQGIEIILNNELEYNVNTDFSDIKKVARSHKSEVIKFGSLLKQPMLKETYPTFHELLTKVSNTHILPGVAMSIIINTPDLTSSIKNQWLRHLIEISSDDEDLKILYEMISDDNYKTLYTSIRKAFRRIDFICYGPPIDIEFL